MTRLLLALLWLLVAVPAWASEEIGRQEDSASANGNVLMPVGCVRQDTVVQDTSADGDYSQIKCTTTGRLIVEGIVTNPVNVQISSDIPGIAGNNSGKAEDAVHASGDTGTMFLGVRHDVSTTGLGTDGDYAAIGLDATGSVYVTVTGIIPGTGATNLGKAEGGTHVNADTGNFSLAVRHDTSTTGLGADGTYAAFGLNSLGELYTQSNTELPAASTLTNNMAVPTTPLIGAVMMCYDGTNVDLCLPGLSDTDDNSVAFSQITTIIIGENYVSDGTSWVRELNYLEDAASAGGEQLKLTGAVRQDTPASSTSADGDYTYLKTDSTSSLWVNCRAGCSGGTQFAEDAVHNSGDTGTLALVRRADAASSSSGTDGDYSTLNVDASGRLWVNCGTGCAGTQYAEDVASAGAESLTLAGTIRQDAPAGTTSADGDYQNLKTDSIGRLWVNCGTGCSGGTQYVEDNASAGGETMTLTAAIRQDTIASSTSADGDFSNLKVNNIGRLYTSATVDAALPTGANTIGNVNPGTAANFGIYVEDAAETAGGNLVMLGTVRRDTQATSSNASGDNSTLNTDSIGNLWVTGSYIEDAAETAGGSLSMAGSVRRDVAATSSNATGDNSTVNTDALGLLWTRDLDPCNGVAKTHIAINISTATTTELTPSLAGASTNYYICSLNLVTAAANNVALVDDDTDNCPSVTSGLAGGLTAASGWNFAANGGIAIGSGISAVFKTAGTNRVLCLVTSAATQLSGSITVAAAP